MIELVFGENSRAVRDYVTAKQHQLEDEHSDNLTIERIDAGKLASAGEMQQVLESNSLFHSEKLVIIRNASTNKDVAEWLSENLESIQDKSIDVFVVEANLDKRSRMYKAFKKADVLKEFKELNPREAATFVQDYVEQAGGSINHAVANNLVSRVGVDQGVIANELDKLMLFNSKITTESVQELTDQTPTDSIFSLVDAITQGRTNAAIDIYRDLRSKQMHPLEILATLGWQMYALVQIKAFSNQLQKAIAKKAGLHPYVVSKSIGLTNRLSRSQLADAITIIADLEEQLKTRDSTRADDLFETALLELIEQLKG